MVRNVMMLSILLVTLATLPGCIIHDPGYYPYERVYYYDRNPYYYGPYIYAPFWFGGHFHGDFDRGRDSHGNRGFGGRGGGGGRR